MSHIMVVDDDPGLREVVDEVFKPSGHTTVLVESGVKCLEVLEEERPDLILMDIRMPELDGWETIREMKKHDIGKTMPVVALTVEELDLQTMVRENIEELVGYIEKPFTKQELLGTVNEILEEIEEIKALESEIKESVKRGEVLGRGYRNVAVKQILHRRFLDKLNEMKEETAGAELDQIKRMIESENSALKMLKLRRNTILRIAGINNDNESTA